MSTEKTIQFSLDLAEVPVVITSKGGKPEKYILREMIGKERSMYQKKLRARLGVVDGKQTLTNTDGLHEELLSCCLRDPAGDLVPVEVLDGWPSKAIIQLYQTASEMNGLGEEAEKNAQGGKDGTGSD